MTATLDGGYQVLAGGDWKEAIIYISFRTSVPPSRGALNIRETGSGMDAFIGEIEHALTGL